jgi:hypothetical protein
MARRTTARSRSGKKLYVKRTKTGQSRGHPVVQRAHGSDIKRRSKAEAAKRTGETTRTRKTGGTRAR